MPGGKKKQQEQPPSSEEESDFDEEFEDEEEEFDLVEAMNSMDLATRRKVYALKGIQEDYNDLMKKYRLELAALELEQEKATAASFERRRKIVNGEEEVKAEEVEAGKKEVSSGKIEEIPDSDDEDDKKKRKGVKVVAPKDTEKSLAGVPDFWLTALRHNEMISQSITERDAEILSFVTDVTSEYLDGKPELGFTLTFDFKENPFFTNKTLTKTCKWDQERKGDEEQIEELKGTKIDWSAPEKNPCVMIKEKKQRHKSGKGVRIVKKEEKCESFFHFFSPIQLNEDGEPIDIEEEEFDAVEEIISQDEDATLLIQNSVVPRAAYFFTGEPMAKHAEAMRAAFGMGGMDGDEDEEEDWGSDEEDEDEDSEEEEPKPTKRGAKGGAKGKTGGHVDPNAQKDCKQQ